MALLTDRFGRRIEYLRISLTDRCNMRCFYCIPNGTAAIHNTDQYLDAPELERIVQAMAARGLRKVRLTGGEPLLRHDLPDIAQRISRTPGIEDLAVSTNALLLNEKAAALKSAGVRRVNISLDSLDPVRFARVTGCALHSKVMRGIHTALDTGFHPIKINIVALPDLDIHELDSFLTWAANHNLHLRFIEEMPFGGVSKRGPDNASIRQMIEQIAGPLEDLRHNSLTNLTQPCRIPGQKWHISFISPMSGPFCEGCNRVRLTATGFLRHCLDEEIGINVGELLDRDVTTEQLGNAIAESIYIDKPERHHFTDPNYARGGRAMTNIGG